MRLQRLTIKDFRSFYGEHVLEFAEGTKRNVTLIHAQNGTGKTALLNALLWAFHEKFTGNFHDKDLLVNNEAARERKTSCMVTVDFAHEGRSYQLVRTYDSTARKSRMTVYETLTNGEKRPHPQQSAFIQQVFPKEMSSYFFFDGEHATNLVTAISSAQIRSAIREMLGCTAAENALADIKVLVKAVNAKMLSLAPTQEMRELQDRRSFLQEVIDGSEPKVQEVQKERATQAQRLEAINEYLAQHAATAEYQKERSSREKELAQASSELKHELAGRAAWVAKNAALICSESVALKCEQLYVDLENRAQIPAPYNEEFVRALLASRRCICERCLEDGSAEVAAITRLLSNATDSVVQRRLVNVKAYCRRLSERKRDAITQLQSIQSRISNVQARCHSLQQRIGELNTLLAGVQNVDLRAQESARAEARNRIETLNAKEARLKQDRQNALQELASVDQKIQAQAVSNAALQTLTRQKTFLDQCSSKLSSALTDLETDALAVLRKDINDLVERIFRSEAEARIDDNFGVRLVSRHGDPLPPSGGQGQLLSFIFLACLIRYCARREKDESVLLQPGTVAPFVLDSPFGQLDPVYRKRAAAFLPEYANQIVFLLSTSQGDPETLSQMRGRIGSEAVLIKENSGSRPLAQKDDAVEEIDVNGQTIVVTYWDRQREMTRIENIAYYREKDL